MRHQLPSLGNSPVNLSNGQTAVQRDRTVDHAARAKSPSFERTQNGPHHLPSVSPLRRMTSTPTNDSPAKFDRGGNALNVAIASPTPSLSSSTLTPLPNAPTLHNNVRAGRRLAVTGGTRSSASGRPTAGMGQRSGASTPVLRRGREKREEEKKLIDRALKTNLRLLQMETDQVIREFESFVCFVLLAH